jgi:hypothetical protein
LYLRKLLAARPPAPDPTFLGGLPSGIRSGMKAEESKPVDGLGLPSYQAGGSEPFA